MKTYCEDCGCKVYNGYCLNCNEKHYIYEQNYSNDEPISFSYEFLEKILQDDEDAKQRLLKERLSEQVTIDSEE